MEKEATSSVQEGTQDGTAVIEPLQRARTQRQWARRKQRVKLLWHLSWRLLITLGLCALTAGVLIAFEHQYIIQDSQKNVFNALLTGLSIGIGLNVAAGLVQIAQHARWFLLSRKPLHVEEFEHVFQCESQTSTLRLMVCKHASIWTRLACLSWLLFNVGIQIVIALLGLSYSLSNPADGGSYHIATTTGNATVPVLNPIIDYASWSNNHTSSIIQQQSQANLYGQQITNFIQVDATDPGFGSSSNALYYGDPLPDTNSSTWWHFFTDYSTTVNPSLPGSNVVTNRVVKSTAACDEWTVENQTYTDSSAEVFISNPYNVYNVSFVAAVGIGDTTYLSFIDDASIISPRSAQVIAIVSSEKPRAFVCNSTLSRVGDYNPNVAGWINEYVPGAIQEEMEIPDEQARILSGAIGWPLNPSGDFSGSVTYANGSWLAITPDQQAVDVAYADISEFVIAAVAAMDQSGPRINVTQTMTPNGGLILIVEWQFAAAVLGVIPFVHFLLVVGVLWMSYHVIIRDDGPYATALLFRPVLDHIPQGGAMLDSREIVRLRAMEDQHLVYTYDHDEEGVAVLKARQVPRKGYEYRKFRDGFYM